MVIIIVMLSKEEYQKLKNRDPDAFQKIFSVYRKHIFNYLKLKVNGNIHTAEDLLSEVFISALENVPGLKDRKKLSSWLLRIANNKFNDYLRKKYREAKYFDKLELETNCGVYEDDMDTILLNKERIVLLNIALENLKSMHKELIIMKYLNEESVKDIALKIGKTDNAVLAILFRAKKALKKEVIKLSKDFYHQ